MKARSLAIALGTAAALAAVAAHAQEVTLKIHHFLPPKGTIQVQVFEPCFVILV